MPVTHFTSVLQNRNFVNNLAHVRTDDSLLQSGGNYEGICMYIRSLPITWETIANEEKKKINLCQHLLSLNFWNFVASVLLNLFKTAYHAKTITLISGQIDKYYIRH